MATEEDGPRMSESKSSFLAALRTRRRRHEQDEREGDQSFWATVGMMGTVGWSVMVPTVGGVFLGRWLDGLLDSGRVFMVFLMLVGLGAGCFLAWRQIAEKM